MLGEPRYRGGEKLSESEMKKVLMMPSLDDGLAGQLR